MSPPDQNPQAPRTAPETWIHRLEGMGIDARAMRGARTVIATMPLSDRPFPGLDGPLQIPKVLFATVGRDRIKCMKPLALFALPMIHIYDCHSASAIEVRIRSVWMQHLEELGRTYEHLRKCGVPCGAKDPGSVVRVSIEGEPAGVEARIADSRQLILPSTGPLSGIALRDRRDRVLPLEANLGEGIELQISISNRMKELTERAEREARHSRQSDIPQMDLAAEQVGVRHHCVLLVGPRLARERGVIDSLNLRGYTVVTARNAVEAVRLYLRCSPELVITDADLGRSEGLELVLMLRELVGVERIPVVVVDSSRHDGRRRAAKEVGAAGYLVHPLDVSRIADRLSRMVDDPGHRRFTRYAEPIAVRVIGSRAPCTATALSRGGLYLSSDENFPTRALFRCELVLPETRRAVEVEAEVLYRLGNSGRGLRGVGLRFERFGGDGEPTFIDFLRSLDNGTSLNAVD